LTAIALQSSVRNPAGAFKSFFRGKGGRPVFKSKRNPVQSYTTRYTNGNIKVEGKKIRLPKLGAVNYRKSRDIEGRIINATVTRTHTGRYYVSVICETETQPMEKTGKSVGIDMGLMSFAVFSDGTDDIGNPGIYKKYDRNSKNSKGT
jgi:putative transposase